MTLQIPEKVDLRKYVEVRIVDTQPPIERSHIRGRRIPVATVAYNYHIHGWSVAETTDNFALSETEVLAALLYYQENKESVDAQEREYQAKLDEMYHLYGNKD